MTDPWETRVRAALGVEELGADGPRAVADVEPEQWHDAVRACRDEMGCDFFDWLSAVDEGEGFRVVAHVWSVAERRGVLLRAMLATGAIASVIDLYPGADWHERETHEMFGVDFTGHPGLRPLLLAPEFEGHPLRKDFVLASRVVKPWPGAKEPGEGHGGVRKRAPKRPPGVPEDWMEPRPEASTRKPEAKAATAAKRPARSAEDAAPGATAPRPEASEAERPARAPEAKAAPPAAPRPAPAAEFPEVEDASPAETASRSEASEAERPAQAPETKSAPPAPRAPRPAPADPPEAAPPAAPRPAPAVLGPRASRLPFAAAPSAPPSGPAPSRRLAPLLPPSSRESDRRLPSVSIASPLPRSGTVLGPEDYSRHAETRGLCHFRGERVPASESWATKWCRLHRARVAGLARRVRARVASQVRPAEPRSPKPEAPHDPARPRTRKRRTR
ncbi:NADH-quinone oxidoreductase subunit C [Glycomyces sp. NPDC046736]|uniref:NADH-quinone oxidoreductase subunit C n=1 Tax=Glycomyces sp. NPDC046736 TaxID=3155615 RepID=UPI0033F7B2E7